MAKWIVLGAVVFGVICGPLVYSLLDSVDNPVTLEDYKRVQNGMTYDDVVSIIGREGIPISSHTVQGTDDLTWRGFDGETRVIEGMDDVTTEIYGWKNQKSYADMDDPRMIVTFQNGRVVSKTQVSLPSQ